MWIYEKKLQYPVQITKVNHALAKEIVTKLSGSRGKLSASFRYLTQRYKVPFPEAKATLTDIGTEELAHLEMIDSMVYQLSEGAFAADFPPVIQRQDDPITMLQNNIADEINAVAAYQYIFSISNDPNVDDVIHFLMQRDIVHSKRFGELLDIAEERTK